jgi:hypothetical protein
MCIYENLLFPGSLNSSIKNPQVIATTEVCASYKITTGIATAEVCVDLKMVKRKLTCFI